MDGVGRWWSNGGDGLSAKQVWLAGVGWGWRWGSADEIGALNSMTRESTLNAIRLVRQGRAFDLGVSVDRSSFRSPAHPSTEVLSFRTPEGTKRQADIAFMDPVANTKQLAFMSGLVLCSDHLGSQIDGLAHVTTGNDNHWYNGFTTEKFGGDFGPRRAGADTTPPIIARGVMLDVAGLNGVERLADGTAVGPDDLRAAAARQKVDLRAGDVVLVRTGSLGLWGEAGHDHEQLRGGDSSGLNLAAARWLVEECGAMVIGSDTSMVEVFPAVDGDTWHPVHEYLLVEQGVHMAELHYLEELAAEGVNEFCYVALLPKLRGITAGFAMRPIALV
jgi:kynurenine formamidase